jgi:hypothetical protein
MKTKAKWEQDILNITINMDKEFPELSKYLNEMPLKVSNKDKDVINIKNLEEYYNSLMEMLEEYSKTHVGVKEKTMKVILTNK